MSEEKKETGDPIIRPFEWLTNASSLQSLLQEHTVSSSVEKSLRALHVGCGSSIVGEFLVEDLNFGLVVNADKDEYTLNKMKQRWSQRCQDGDKASQRKLEFCLVDFAKENFPFDENFFDLVLDKSTLDCTLCSDNATASLLLEVYRCLAIGGCYLLVSFHDTEMLYPLLQNLPGAQWDILHTTMPRQVEDIHQVNDLSSSQEEHTSNTTHDKKPLNVFIARRIVSTNNILDYDEVCQHVHRCNDEWFQQHQPLLTRTRTQALEKTFQSPLDLKEAYQEMFTDAEREHLTFEHFLEDWHAFLQEQNSGENNELPPDMISYSTVMKFLTAMQ
jgi:ubiquinone/menaquinone biosynthesis C-methylase UbiE